MDGCVFWKSKEKEESVNGKAREVKRIDVRRLAMNYHGHLKKIHGYSDSSSDSRVTDSLLGPTLTTLSIFSIRIVKSKTPRTSAIFPSKLSRSQAVRSTISSICNEATTFVTTSSPLSVFRPSWLTLSPGWPSDPEVGNGEVVSVDAPPETDADLFARNRNGEPVVASSAIISGRDPWHGESSALSIRFKT